MAHRYFNNWHLGDCIWHCVFLRRVASLHPQDKFEFYCHPQYHAELNKMLEDLSNVSLHPLDQKPDGCIDCWIGTGAYNGRQYWHHHPQRNDMILFLIDWFGCLCKQSGFDSPFNERQHCLLDYPGLHQHAESPDYDYLIVNAEPKSGQLRWNAGSMNRLVERLSSKYRVITTNRSSVDHLFCTERMGYSVTQIGNISMRASAIIMVATGPCWATFNPQNLHKDRIVLLDGGIRLNYGCEHPHFSDAQGVENHLQQKGIL